MQRLSHRRAVGMLTYVTRKADRKFLNPFANISWDKKSKVKRRNSPCVTALVVVPEYRKGKCVLKLGFHIRGKRKRHALCVIRPKWKSM